MRAGSVLYVLHAGGTSAVRLVTRMVSALPLFNPVAIASRTVSALPIAPDIIARRAIALPLIGLSTVSDVLLHLGQMREIRLTAQGGTTSICDTAFHRLAGEEQ